MRAVLLGHGWYENSQDLVEVPAHLSVFFYAEPDETMLLSLGFAGLSTGLETGGIEKKKSGEAVINYTLSPYTDGQMARALTAALNEDELFFAGDQLPAPIKLCDGTIETCHDGQHACDGVFGLCCEGVLANYDEIYFLACRMRIEAFPKKPTRRMPGEEAPKRIIELEKERNEIMDLVRSGDEENAGLRFDFLTQEMQAILLNFDDLREWSIIREARRFVQREGAVTFYHYYVNETSAIKYILQSDDSLFDALQSVREQYTAGFKSESRENRQMFWSELTDQMRIDLREDDDIERWARAFDARDVLHKNGMLALYDYYLECSADSKSRIEQDSELGDGVDFVRASYVENFQREDDAGKRHFWAELDGRHREDLVKASDEISRWAASLS